MNHKILEEDIMDMVMDHYDNPRNYGKLENPDIVQNGGNPGCGDSLTIYMKIDDNDVVVDAAFDGKGCIISQSTSSMLTEYIKGRKVSEITELDTEFLKELIGKDIIIRRPQCSRLALDTIRYGLRNYKKKQKN
ncbi:MAG: iron-sulfur cluster assembly scaffold protein [Candidatus Dadabacteria bacterium]|nr:iron-sulfur cluster assembly scaffold protein [Candidatus Dadabacteria bacterium]NIQ16457.1 iron-sulfur cluster assembly scaffold protein [Candidatus Dadabacteria bacterium]